ncbi:hypothetical protein K525DRAFT_269561 [Schizophyllum commune Loenen D]|nr:hypothetical protein K525DRAFT_269561 [Schizophyllum commune Loenen D]
MSLATPARAPLAPLQSTAFKVSLQRSSAFEQLLTKVTTEQPSSSSPQREAALRKAADSIKAVLPHLNDKLYNAVVSSPPSATSQDLKPARQSHSPAKVNEPCHKWLLAHLHNPYPTREEWEMLARESQTSVREVASWFMSARKRIGWSQLRATRFGRSQVGIVEAAARFWPERDASRPLEPDLELRFAEIEANATSLYSDALHPSPTLYRAMEEVRLRAALNPSTEVPPVAVHGKKRKTSDSHLDVSEQRSKRRCQSHCDDVTIQRPLAGRPVASSTPPVSAQKDTSRRARVASTSEVPRTMTSLVTLPTVQHTFGEPSLSLKRSSSLDLEVPSAKRQRVLPVWRDPLSPQARTHRGPRVTKTPDGQRSSTSRRSSSSSSSARKDRDGRSHDGRRTVSAPVAPHPVLDATIDGLAWPSVLSLPSQIPQQPEVSLPSQSDDTFDFWHISPSGLDADIPLLASDGISYNQSPPVDAPDSFAEFLSSFDDVATSPTSSASSSPPGSAPTTPPKLVAQLTGDSAVDVGTDPWGGLFGLSEPTYNPYSDSLAPSSLDIDFLSMLANDKPLCEDGYSPDGFLHPCGWWESTFADTSSGIDVAPIAPAAVAERPGKRALPAEDEYLDLTPTKRRRLTPAAA